jgi:hypothetical protein
MSAEILINATSMKGYRDTGIQGYKRQETRDKIKGCN